MTKNYKFDREKFLEQFPLNMEEDWDEPEAESQSPTSVFKRVERASQEPYQPKPMPRARQQTRKTPRQTVIRRGGKNVGGKSQHKPTRFKTVARSIDGVAGSVKENYIGENFEQTTVDSVAKVARFVWSVMVRGTLYGALLGSMLADIIGGAIALSLIFTNSSSFAGINIGTALVAGGLSIFTSGVQVVMMLSYARGNKLGSMSVWESIGMWTLALVDTLFDMTVPFWWAYGETPLTIQVGGKPFMFYLSVILFAVTCLVSERFILWVAKQSKDLKKNNYNYNNNWR